MLGSDAPIAAITFANRFLVFTILLSNAKCPFSNLLNKLYAAYMPKTKVSEFMSFVIKY